MKKIMLVVALCVFAGVTNADAGYYRTKNSLTGRYESTGRVNNMGMKRAPSGHHTDSWGNVHRNTSF